MWSAKPPPSLLMNKTFMRDSLKKVRGKLAFANAATAINLKPRDRLPENSRRGLTHHPLVGIAIESFAQLVDFLDRERSDVLVEVRADWAIAGCLVVGQVLLPIAQSGEDGGQVTNR